MKRQIPRGEPDLICPLHQRPMEDVCHHCPWWSHIRGTNPNTGEEVDRWQCAIAMLPLLLIETASQARQTGAAVESLRNVVAETPPIFVPAPMAPLKEIAAP